MYPNVAHVAPAQRLGRGGVAGGLAHIMTVLHAEGVVGRQRVAHRGSDDGAGAVRARLPPTWSWRERRPLAAAGTVATIAPLGSDASAAGAQPVTATPPWIRGGPPSPLGRPGHGVRGAARGVRGREPQPAR
eukprot:COSAG04_NODE_3629_length_2661_cov_212.139735_4_plen_131_part_01